MRLKLSYKLFGAFFLILVLVSGAMLFKAGFTVTCLSRGDEAVGKINRCAPALVLLDIMLPGVDGIAVCREVR